MGALPLIAEFARRLKIQAIIDPLCCSRGNAHLSHGQVAGAILAHRLTPPRAIYRILDGAQKWGVEPLFGIDPNALNEDRLGRCLDALAPHLEAIQGTVAATAVAPFALDRSQMHGDLTSVVLQGASPPEQQQPSYPKPAYGFGCERGCQQLRAGERVTREGGVPIWHRSDDGPQADVGTLVSTMEARRRPIPLPDCWVIGDTKRRSEKGIPALRTPPLHVLGPWSNRTALDQEYLGLPPENGERLDSLAKRQERRPEEKRTTSLGPEVPWEGIDPETGATPLLRRLDGIRSEARAPGGKVRAQQRERAEAEWAKIRAGRGKRPRKTGAQVPARVEPGWSARHVSAWYRVTVAEASGERSLRWQVDEAALSRAEALDGDDVLLTRWPTEKAPPRERLKLWKQEEGVERRYCDWKGALPVRPVCVSSNARIAARWLRLPVALRIYCLVEREARRRLAAEGRSQVGRLLAGQVAAVPTGEKILRAFEALYRILEEEEHGRQYHLSARYPEQAELWRLLRIQTPVWC